MYTNKDIDDYQNRLTKEQKGILLSRCNSIELPPVICAWYDDEDDFFTDWVGEVGFSIGESRDVLHGENVIEFENGEIIRLEN